MEEKSNDSTNEPKKEIKRLKRSSKNKYIFGVCGGIAEFFEIDASIIRILWVMSIFLGGLGLVLYLASALIMPKSEEETETSDNKSIDNNRAGLLVGSLLIFLGFIFLLGQLRFFNIHFILPAAKN
jgi:phage shock protein C